LAGQWPEAAHRRGFKVSRDPRFVEKLEDIVGLYMSPPEHALVLSCDEKSQVQALERTQPGLPLKKGRAQTMTHDYKRHGTTTLFAALNMLDGQIIGQCQQRHTHAEWLKFLRKIDRETPKDKTLHLIADNYATHKHPAVQQWLAQHPRFNMHFEVDPISRTPHPVGRRSPTCLPRSPRTRRSSDGRWSSWFRPAASPRSSRVSSTSPRKASRLGSRKLQLTTASLCAARMY
jgi:hypothetical protein